MSQSDYLKFKKTGTILKENPTSLPGVLHSDDYTLFKEYRLQTTIENSKPTYNKLALPNKKVIFDMELDASGSCPTFLLCSDTNTRSNRKPTLAYQQLCFPIMKAPGRSVPTYYNGSGLKRPERENCDCLRKPWIKKCNC